MTSIHESGLEGLDNAKSIVTSFVDDQMFGLPVLSVHDILRPQPLTRVPLAPNEVAGVLNLRGRVVTAVDMRRRLGLEEADIAKAMSVVAVHNGEWYSLLFDQVGEVIPVDQVKLERNPPTLKDSWSKVSSCVAKLPDRLMVILDIASVLSIGNASLVASSADA